MNTKENNFKVIWSNEDQEWIGLCKEYPLCSWLDKNYVDAYFGIRNLIDDIEKDIEND